MPLGGYDCDENSTEIKLEIEHVNPLNDGYSLAYGYPDEGNFDENGFRDIFRLSEGYLEERFKIRYTYIDLSKLDYDDLDPEGYGDYLAELEYGD